MDGVSAATFCCSLRRPFAQVEYAKRFHDICDLKAKCDFLDVDGLIVPSARSAAHNLVIFTEELDLSEMLKVQASEAVDWSAWRAQRQNPTSP